MVARDDNNDDNHCNDFDEAASVFATKKAKTKSSSSQ